MLDVLIALLPTTIAGLILAHFVYGTLQDEIFGFTFPIHASLRAALVVVFCVGSCVGFEALFNLIVKKKQTIGDLSAAVTGLLLALNLPANIPLGSALWVLCSQSLWSSACLAVLAAIL
jgi:Na+-translocating ferredoxin:NAD+ oxidoreductase RnfD subunit